MEITARQLKAIEDAIGRNAEAKVILQPAGHHWDYVRPICIQVEATHKGQKVRSQMHIETSRDIPMVHIAERLVTDINRHIMDKEFREVFRG